MHVGRMAAAVFLLGAATLPARAQVLITELVAENEAGLQDEDGDRPDWIELFNAGASPVLLSGWRLTDDPAEPGRWTFPLCGLAPGQFLVVFASDKNRTNAAGTLHTNFKLKAAGEYLALSRPDGTIEHEYAPQFPPQSAGPSYGLPMAGGAVTSMTPVYFVQPTPGAANTGVLAGYVADVQASPGRGFFTNAFTVQLACATPDATLVYTGDGSVPSPTNGIAVAGTPTGGPSVSLVVTGTTLLRARAFRAGWAPSASAAHTYLFPAQVPYQPVAPPGYPTTWTQSNGQAYSCDYGMDPRIAAASAYSNRLLAGLQAIPTLSIGIAVPDLFDRGSGIYANPLSDGTNWERAASVEWMDPATGRRWQCEAGLRIQGGYFRQPTATPKHSFRLVFRGVYGTPVLHERVFDEPGAAEAFDSLTLRAQANDGYSYSWANGANVLYLRDQFGRELMRDLGQPAPRGNYVHLYLNGLYWGLYNPVEHADESFSATYFGGDKSEWDSINSGELISGTMEAWTTLVAQCQSGMASYTNYLRVQGLNPDGTPNPAYPDYVEIDDCIDYILLNLWGGNWDWPSKNYWVGRRRGGPDGFRFYLWDYEDTIGTQRSPLGFQASTSSGVALPHSGLVASPEYRLRFADHIQRHFYTAPLFAPTNLIARFTNLAARLASSIAAESARWGDQRYASPYTPAQWDAAVANIVASYLPNRTAIALNQFRSAGLYPGIAAPAIAPPGGLVEPGAPVTITATSAVYFTRDGTDPRAFGTGEPAGLLYTGAAPLGVSCVVKARARSGTTWSALVEYPFVVRAAAPLRVSEVMYHPRAPSPTEAAAGFAEGDFEFVELHNVGDACGWTGWRATAGPVFDFAQTNAPALAPGGYALLARNPAALALRYGTAVAARVVGVFSNSLDNGGETIALERALTGERLSFAYGGRGWPAAAAGAGHSLVPRAESDPTGHALNHGANWRASAFRDGSPGAADPEPAADLVLNEIAAHTATNLPGRDSDDWIELYNVATAAVDLADWYLSDDPDDLAKWALPAPASAPPRSWVAYDEVTGFRVDTNAGFGLSAAGESVFLSHLPGTAADRVADAVDYPGQAEGAAGGRYPDGEPWWRTLDPTPGASNRLPGARIVISELMFHPPDTNAPPQDNRRDEYVELLNAGTGPVALENSNGAWRIAGSIDFSLPAGVTLAPAERLLLVSFAPTNTEELAAFRAAQGWTGLPGRVEGPYAGSLPNDEGRVSVEYPAPPGTPGDPIVWAVEDEAIYFDAAPWTRGADGNGLALHRIDPAAAGSQPASWRAGLPSPAGAAVDLPPLSLAIEAGAAEDLRLTWPARAGLLYDLEWASDPAAGWLPLLTVESTGSTASAQPNSDIPVRIIRGLQRDR